MYNKITVTGANKLFFLFTTLFLVFQVVLGFLVNLWGDEFVDNNMYGILLFNEFILVLIPTLLYARWSRLDFREVFRLKPFGVLPGLLILLITIPASFVANMLNMLIVFLLQNAGDVPPQPIPVPGSVFELIIGLLVVAVSPAICEEILHRGLLLKAYENRGTKTALVASSLFFGIFHFDLTNLLGPVVLGLLIGYYVLRTDSIFAGMLAHFSNNALAEILQFLARMEEGGEASFKVSAQEINESIAFGVIGVILVILLLKLFNKAVKGKIEYKPPISSVRKDAIDIVTHWPVMSVLMFYIFAVILFLLSLAGT